MGVWFGQQLRARRVARGMSQRELGGETYSPSYVSLLETGRREPTEEVIHALASRLELAPLELESWNYRITTQDADYALEVLCTRQAWDVRDYAQAGSHAMVAAQIALEARNISGWWDSRRCSRSRLAFRWAS